MQVTVVKQRRKTAAIVISEKQEIIIKVPYYMTDKQLKQFLAENENWIEQTAIKKKEHLEQSDWYITGKQLFMGKYWPIRIKTVYGAAPMIIFNEELGFVLTTNGSEKDARGQMEKFYRNKAKEILPKLASEYAKDIGVNYEQITIRKQATRWGSCSSKGNLSFNMKIMCAPLEAIKYVVLHEVVHLKHFDHSRAFWQEIERWMPDYKKQVNYFKEFGQNFII